MGCAPPAPTPRRSTTKLNVICPANSATEKIATPIVSTASAPATTMYAPPSPAESVHRGTGQDGSCRNVRRVAGHGGDTSVERGLERETRASAHHERDQRRRELTDRTSDL